MDEASSVTGYPAPIKHLKYAGDEVYPCAKDAT